MVLTVGNITVLGIITIPTVETGATDESVVLPDVPSMYFPGVNLRTSRCFYLSQLHA